MSYQDPLLTIIIPTYNSSATLDATLESIYNQTFKNVEVLIMDGLSTDKTLELVGKFQKYGLNIISFSEADDGIYDAMNKGIVRAKGNWIYFLGSDDTLYENTTLEKFAGLKELSGAEVIYGNVVSPRFGGVYDGQFNYSKLAVKNICHQSIFFNKGIFKKTGTFNLKYKAHADWDHNIKWFYSSKIISVFVPIIFAHYADGGFSSINNDHTFAIDKNIKLLKRGIGKLTFFEMKDICKDALNQAKINKSKKKILLLSPIHFIFKSITVFK